MKIDNKDLLNSILENLSCFRMPHSDDLPNIDLYMDQVTTYMERYLSVSKRHEEDKILTKTMINNYAKNNLLPPPEKKKYTKEHILTLIYIYYFKNLLSINDIQAILNPLTKRYFSDNASYTFEEIYDEVLKMTSNEMEELKEDVIRKYAISNTSFPDAKKNEESFLHNFSMICMLSMDIYVKKQIVEQMIDAMVAADTPPVKKPVPKDVKKEVKKEVKKQPKKEDKN